MSIKTKIDDFLFSAKVGAKVVTFNDGKPCKSEYQLHFKNIYIHLLEGDDDWWLGWQYSPVGHLPVREIIEVEESKN